MIFQRLRHIYERYALYLVRTAYESNKTGILSLLEDDSSAILVDLGCDTCEFTGRIAAVVGTKTVIGIDVVQSTCQNGLHKDISPVLADLNKCIPLANASADVLTANQVIEHLTDIDTFAQEIYRVLKPGGYAIVSTENLSGIHNLSALLMGYQPFTLMTMSRKGIIGNPLGLSDSARGLAGTTLPESYGHQKAFAYKGFFHFMELHGFRVDAVRVAGFDPLPASFARFVARVDRRHARYMTAKIRKPC